MHGPATSDLTMVKRDARAAVLSRLDSPLASPIEREIMVDKSNKGGRAQSDESASDVRKGSGCPMHGDTGPWAFTRRAFVLGSTAVAATLVGCGPEADGTPMPMDGGGADASDAGDGGDASLGDARADSVYRIHPAIGVARLGNADPSQFFIGPEAPGMPPLNEAPGTAAPPYKADGMVKPQAARFRLFEYRRQNGRLVPVREVNLDTPGVARIEWTAHLANKKASFHQFNGLQGERTAPRPVRNASVTDRASLEIDFGPRTISGRAHAPAEFRAGTSATPADETYPRRADGSAVIDYLGQLRTDDKGRLILLGGRGVAAYAADRAPGLPSYCNNDGWFDDVSDGPVTATVVIEENGMTRSVPVDGAGGAWAIVSPPTFAPGILACTSLYDLLFDLGVREIAIPDDNGLYADGAPLERLRRLHEDFHAEGDEEFPSITADYTDEIEPMLVTGYNFRWVTAAAVGHHESLIDPTLGDPSPATAPARGEVFGYMRPPVGATPPDGPQNMPKLLGSDPYTTSQPDNIRMQTLTRTQIGLMRRWAGGNFTAARTAPPRAPAITPHGLDRAALENCCGGAFFPGIEVGWQIRNPALYVEPFRINLAGTSGYHGEEGQPLRPGHFTRQMALPWHADFNDCQREGSNGWWPSARPDDVFLAASDARPVRWTRPDGRYPDGAASTHADMIAYWFKFGFVVKQGEAFLETERAERIP